MIRIEWIGIGLFLMTGCKHSEPAATKYKKSFESASPDSGGGGTPKAPNDDVIVFEPEEGGGGGGDTSLRAQGEALYASTCAGCHLEIASSKIKYATATEITENATRSDHKTVKPYPNAEEAKALEAALK